MRVIKFKKYDKDIDKLEYEVRFGEKSGVESVREIKYRAYHKKKGLLVDVLSICFTNRTVDIPIETDDTDSYWWHSTTWDLEDVELMQYTGLKDVKGRGIYEGDIVLADSEYGEKVRDIVCWSYGSFYVANHTIKKLNNIEVIGNTYENPNLLKENEK